MIIDCISDLHGNYPKLDGGDLLIFVGDFQKTEHPSNFFQFCKWIDCQKYRKKVCIAGNHDTLWERDPPSDFNFFWDYLCDSGTEFEGLKIWGSPWTLKFKGQNPKAMAFSCNTEEELADKWAMIPEGIDILITHSPPYGIKDKTVDGKFVGSETLAYEIGGRKSPPKMWVWGHIHESYGIDMPVRQKPILMLNASHVNEKYQPVNKPIRIEL